MNIKWPERKLSDISTMIDYRGKTPQKSTSGIPLITAKIVKNGTILPANEFIAESQYASWMTRGYPCVGDVVMTTEAPLGEVAQLRDAHVALAQRIITIRGKKDVLDNGYLKYFLQSAEGQGRLRARETGTTVTGIKAAELRELMIPLPDIMQQRKISKVLLDLDEKIYNLTQENHNLEEQAKAIYATYFPYSVDDALPDDWRKGTLGEIIDLHDSKRIPLSGNERGKMEKIYPYYGAASLMDYVNDYLFDGVFLLLGEDGTVVTDNGLPVLQYVWGKFWVNNHAHILTGKAGFSVESLLLLLKQTPVKSIVTGAVQPKISQANLKSIQIVIPPEKLLQEFNSVITPLFALIRQNSEESKRLAQLRDTLLPKLMSGEIDVSEVEV